MVDPVLNCSCKCSIDRNFVGLPIVAVDLTKVWIKKLWVNHSQITVSWKLGIALLFKEVNPEWYDHVPVSSIWLYWLSEYILMRDTCMKPVET